MLLFLETREGLFHSYKEIPTCKTTVKEQTNGSTLVDQDLS